MTQNQNHHYNPRPRLEWQHEADFTAGAVTARVTSLAFEVPQYSIAVGTLRPDNTVKPFVNYRAASLEQLDALERTAEDAGRVFDEASAYVLDKYRTLFAEREAAAIKAAEQRVKEAAAEVEREKAARERAERKKRNHTANHERRREENRQRARGGSGGGKKKG